MFAQHFSIGLKSGEYGGKSATVIVGSPITGLSACTIEGSDVTYGEWKAEKLKGSQQKKENRQRYHRSKGILKKKENEQNE
jgi:hypothetical protein